jgi:putative hydrolase of the HAD superfamily
MGVRKPAEEYFHRVVRALGVKPGECVFVDDMEINIRAAQRLGLRTILFQSVAQIRTV